MAEHRPEPAQQLPDHVQCLAVYGLDNPDEGVTAWVLALPGGRAFIVSSNEESSAGMIDTTLDRVVRWWAPRRGADLLLVTD